MVLIPVVGTNFLPGNCFVLIKMKHINNVENTEDIMIITKCYQGTLLVRNLVNYVKDLYTDFSELYGKKLRYCR